MKKDDAKEIKNIINTALETHLGSVHEEISDLRTEVKKDLSELEERLTGKIDKVDAKLGAFENNEIDKRLQLEVRVTSVEKRLRLSKTAKLLPPSSDRDQLSLAPPLILAYPALKNLVYSRRVAVVRVEKKEHSYGHGTGKPTG